MTQPRWIGHPPDAKICVVCQCRFTPSYQQAKICSDECRGERRMARDRTRSPEQRHKESERRKTRRRLLPPDVRARQKLWEQNWSRTPRGKKMRKLAYERWKRSHPEKLAEYKRRHYEKHRQNILEKLAHQRAEKGIEVIRAEKRREYAKRAAAWKILQELAKRNETIRSVMGEIMGEINDLA